MHTRESDIDKLRKENNLLRSEIEHIKKKLSFKSDDYILFDSTPSGIIIVGDNYKIEYVNKALAEIFGLTTKQLIGQDFREKLSGKNPDILADKYIRRRKGETIPEHYEFDILHPDGNVRFLELSSATMVDQLGSLKTIAQIIDITEKKRASFALIESEEKYRNLVDNSPNGIVVSDLKGKFLTVNKKFLEMCGYASDEELYNSVETVFDLIAEEHKQLAWDNANKTLAGIKSGSFYYTTLRKDGTRFPAEINSVILKNYNGEPNTFLSICRDLTQRQKAEIALQEYSHRLSNIMLAANDGMWDWYLESGKVIFDPRYYQMAGYEIDEFPHRLEEFQKRLHPEELDNVMLQAQLHLEGKLDRYIVEFRFLRKNNTWMWILARGIITERDKEGNPVKLMGTHTDISELKKIQNDLQEAKNKAEESDRLKSAFLANMSHEIRTPMNGILGFAEIISKQEFTDDELQQYVSIIKKSGDRMLNTINDIIDISRIESGQTEIVYSISSINQHLSYLHNFFLPEAKSKGLSIIFTKSLSEQKASIRTDHGKIIAIFMNLLKNSLKFTKKGEINFGYKVGQKELVFFVSDTGIGISEDRIEAIFDRFVQADLTITKAYEGSGLGLSISKAFIELLGGKIWVESEINKGSTFYFTIPYATSTEAELTEDLIEKQIPKTRKMNNLTVLIVDDDESALFFLNEVLKSKCKKIIHAKTGLEAVEICMKDASIGLILMDIKLPELDGYQATKQIRAFNSKVIIIGQTAYALVGDRKKVIEAGCDDYLSKPIDRNELLT